MTRFALLCSLLSLTACGRAPECCDTPDCSGGSEKIVGSDVLRFRGQVPTNLLFISIDTLRKDHIGVYDTSGRPSLTPFLDRIAAEGVVATDHIQCSNWTFGSMTCTVAGRSNPDRGHLPRIGGTPKQRPPVPEDTPFLATWLSEAGFVTSLTTGNNWFSDRERNTQGYDFEKKLLDTQTDEIVLTGAKRMRRQSNGGRKPWFLHTHVMEPHLPYSPPDRYVDPDPGLEPWPEDLSVNKGQGYWRKIWPDLDDEERALLEAHTRLLYEGEVRTVDDRLAQAWEQLDADCMLDDTLVVFFTDHGEGFWEHGTHAHAHYLTAEENDGALLFWAKNLVPGTWDSTTSGIDLVPTLLDLYELPVPDEVTGLPIGTAGNDRAVFAETIGYNGPIQAVVKDGYKLQYHWSNGQLRLWNRTRDPHEQSVTLAPTGPVAADLWTALQPEFERMQDAMINGPEPVLPANPPE